MVVADLRRVVRKIDLRFPVSYGNAGPRGARLAGGTARR